MEGSLGRFIAAARQALVHHVEAEHQLVALTRVHVATEALRPQISLVTDNEVRALSEENGQRIRALRDEYEALWAKTLAAGVGDDIFSTGEPRLARLALLEMCNGVGRWFSPTGRLSLEEVSDHFANMALALVEAHRDGSHIHMGDLTMRPAGYEIHLVENVYADFPA